MGKPSCAKHNCYFDKRLFKKLENIFYEQRFHWMDIELMVGNLVDIESYLSKLVY